MKSGFTPKTVLLWFVVVLGLYVAIFYGIEYSNQRKGPWAVEFGTEASGVPRITIEQPRLGISKVKIRFSGENVSATNGTRQVLFDRPVSALPAPMPFGELIYEDLRTLPGVVTFNFFGHEVELLPRVLVADKKEVAWRPATVLDLFPSNKPPRSPKPPKGWEAKPLQGPF
jgi:hypothetical protein